MRKNIENKGLSTFNYERIFHRYYNNIFFDLADSPLVPEKYDNVLKYEIRFFDNKKFDLADYFESLQKKIIVICERIRKRYYSTIVDLFFQQLFFSTLHFI